MRARYIKWLLYVGILFLALIVSIGIALSFGEMQISLLDLPSILRGEQGKVAQTIVQQIRLPRVYLGIAVGGCLSLSGVILQGIYRNPLVEPFTLGISGGAALGVAITFLLGLQFILGSIMLPIAGFIGAFVTIFLVYILSVKQGRIRIQSMLLIGVMISFIASSAMMLLMAISTAENLHGIVFWIMGSLDEPNRFLVYLNLGVAILGLLLSYLFIQPLNALRLGEDKARHLGINTETSIRLLFIIASLMAGISVAVAGVIGFVGLVIPHVIRMFVGSDYRVLLIASFLGGSTFILICDALARVLIMPNELPIGVVTGIVGGIAFVVILSRSSFKSTKL